MAKKIKKIQLPDGEILDLGGTGGGASMFDTKILDHELTFEESEGWALQGTYVYKEAVAGSRYGYPTFIEKCIEEKELGTPTEVTLGDSTITMYINANGHQFYDIADKEAVDAWYDTYGTAWYYGVDTSAERVFLPRNKWFIQPTDDVSKVNSVNEAGLPNITGSFGLRTPFNQNDINSRQSGAFGNTAESGGTTSISDGGDFKGKITFDASLSNPIYGNSDKVQPQSLNQLLYICVGNTSVNEALTDVIDITTSENDTLPLGYSTYQADNLSSAGWLKSTGFFESGTTYVTFYNEYRTRIGEKFSGGYVRSVDDTYTDYDLVIDEDNLIFRLPLRNGQEGMFATPVVGDGMALGLTDGTNYGGLSTYSNSTLEANIDNYGDIVGSAAKIADLTASKVIGVTTDPTKSGIVTDPSATVVPDGWALYYKVGNAVQHLEVVDMLHEAELNNPFFFGMYQYFQTEPNNASWLASLGQWNSKGTYTDYYNWILENVGKDYFKLSTEEYTDYDWVVNKTDETFRLPVKVKGASGSAVVGNGMALGLTNGTTGYGLISIETGSATRLAGQTGAYGTPVYTSNSGDYATTGVSIGITTDPTKSGIETSTDGLTLYFYVGEVLQSANLINAGRALEKIARIGSAYMGKPSDRYIDLTLNASGTTYIAPADGWVAIWKAATASNQYITLETSLGMGGTNYSTGTNSNLALSMPVSKNQVFKVSYNAGGTTGIFRFIYAEGSK